MMVLSLLSFYNILSYCLGKTKSGDKKDTSKALPDAYSPKYVEVRNYIDYNKMRIEYND